MTTLDKIKAEIQKVLDQERDFYSENAKAQAMALMWCLEIIDKYASEECDRDCEHCAYIECPKEPTTLKQIIEKHNMDKLAYDEMSDFERNVLKYAEQEPCEDAVSRQAVIDNIKHGFHWETVNGITAETVLKQVIHDVEIMPSVQPKEEQLRKARKEAKRWKRKCFELKRIYDECKADRSTECDYCKYFDDPLQETCRKCYHFYPDKFKAEVKNAN